jgi:adenine/guanine phosphoribosyltransferase-like PRPP-binding protein
MLAAVSSQTDVPLAASALKRVKATVQQVGLSRSERAANIQGAFRVQAEGKAAIASRRLVLVDDVLTSGATAEGCARALLRAGAAHVDVLVFARVADAAQSSIYSHAGKALTRSYGFRRNLHAANLSLLSLGEGTSFSQRCRLR